MFAWEDLDCNKHSIMRNQINLFLLVLVPRQISRCIAFGSLERSSCLEVPQACPGALWVAPALSPHDDSLEGSREARESKCNGFILSIIPPLCSLSPFPSLCLFLIVFPTVFFSDFFILSFPSLALSVSLLLSISLLFWDRQWQYLTTQTGTLGLDSLV